MTMAEKSMPICITGMHRSGTSMVARLLNLCGCYLGEGNELIPATPDNPDGHWEHAGFVSLNDEILNELGGGWDHPPTGIDLWPNDALLLPFRDRIAALLERFRDREPWGWKDPRTSLTLPFWRNVVGDLRVVVCLRNPLEVCLSLQRRGLCSYSLALSLWSAYYESILHWTTKEDRVVTHYAAYFPNALVELKRISGLLNLDVSDELMQRAATTTKGALRHNCFRTRHLFEASVAPDLVRMYLDLCEEAQWSDPTEEPKSCAAEIGAVDYSLNGRDVRLADRTIDLQVMESECIRRELKASKDALQRRDAQIRHLQSVLAEAEAQQKVEDPNSAGSQLEEIRAALGALGDTISRQEAHLCSLRQQVLGLATASNQQQTVIERWQEHTSARLDEVQSLLYSMERANDPGLGSARHDDNEYQKLVQGVRGVAAKHVPAHASVLVIGRGDDALLRLSGHRASHFPQMADGSFAGYYPHSGEAAVVHLEWLRARGANYLLIPATSKWWLEKYPEFRRHLLQRYRLAVETSDCQLYDLKKSLVSKICYVLEECQDGMDEDPSMLDWSSGIALKELFANCSVLSAARSDIALPYVDRSIDLLILDSQNTQAVSEARRVARQAILFVDRSDDGVDKDLRIEWQADQKRAWNQSLTVIVVDVGDAEGGRACLHSLLETLPSDYQVRVIVVSDTMTAGPPFAGNSSVAIEQAPTEDRESAWNAARRLAMSTETDNLVFITSDIVLLPGSLLPLLRVLRDQPDAGVVGPKIVFADGATEIVGGAMFRDGTTLKIGGGDRGHLQPWYDYLRETDFCAPLCFATRAQIFKAVNGLDHVSYLDADCAMVDYCFKVRDEGSSIYVQPESTVVHCRLPANTSDVMRVPRRFQERWKEALGLYPNWGADRNIDQLVPALVTGTFGDGVN